MEGGELQDGSAVLAVTDEEGRAADAGADLGAKLLDAACGGRVDAMRALLEHPSADPAALLMHADSQHGFTALMCAAVSGHVEAMRVLLDHPSADPAAMMMHTNSLGNTALLLAVQGGCVDVMRVLLDHPAADAAAMMMVADSQHGSTALMFAVQGGRMDAMRLLLDHPAADPAAMMRHTNSLGSTLLVMSAINGHVDAMRLLLDHPSADAAAMIAHRTTNGISALISAAAFAASVPDACMNAASAPAAQARSWDYAPLLLLLRRVAVEPHPSDAQQDHMTLVMEFMCASPPRRLFDVDQPDAVREACVRLLLEHGARFDSPSPVGLRIRRELASWAWRFAG
jgi:hypothetical protein